MAITIYLKDGAYIDDCLIDSIHYEPETDTIQFTDRFGKQTTRKYSTISCIVIKGLHRMKIINHDDGTATAYTEAGFNMYNLRCIAQENTLTLEQQNAIDYGISAIKTLIDMGVLK